MPPIEDGKNLYDEKTIKDIVSSVLKELNPNQTKVETKQMKSKAEEITAIVSAVVAALTPLIRELKCKHEESQVTAQSEEILNLKIDLDDANQYSRRDSVRITGLIKKENETQDELLDEVIKIGEWSGAGTEKTDISVAHRLPNSRNDANGAPPVIVKFISRNGKESFYRNKKNLKTKPEAKNIYISEDLTRLRYRLLQETKKCVQFKSLTTVAGRILVWREGNARPTVVVHPSDLTKLGLVPDYKELGLCK